MGHKLLNRILPRTGRDNWTVARWRRHLLSEAETQAERDDIIAMFMD